MRLLSIAKNKNTTKIIPQKTLVGLFFLSYLLVSCVFNKKMKVDKKNKMKTINQELFNLSSLKYSIKTNIKTMQKSNNFHLNFDFSFKMIPRW